MTNNAQFDRNTLAAVKPGMDSTLAEITAQMERYLGAPGSNVVALEKARTELQSLLGVQKMVGLDGVAVFCTELANSLSELAANPQQLTAMHRDVLRRALFGITHYLDALANGVDNATLRLFPEYQELQQLRGLEMSFELDLFYPNLAVKLPQQILTGSAPNDAPARLKVMRSQYQQGLLRWFKQEDAAAALQQMQQALAGALRCVPQDESRAFWWVAHGLIECLKLDCLPAESNVRKLLGRIDQQLRTVADGNASDVRPVLNEMLYLIGRSHAESEQVDEIKQVYALDNYLPSQNTLPPGEVDQLLGIMRDQLRVAEESWELCVQGDKAACEKFLKYVEQLATQSEKLDRDVLQYLANQIKGLSQYATAPEHARPIAMDMAMALLLLGSGIENYNRLGSGFQEQARILAERMQAAVKQQPEDITRMTELVDLHYEMEQRGDVMGPLANEMLVNLQLVEQGLNAFFNDAVKRDGLTELLRLLSQIQGGFRISSLTHAEHLLTSVQDRVRRFVRGNDIPRSAERYALADALSALENYMQHLIHGQAGDVWRLDEALSEMVKLDQVAEPVVTAPIEQRPPVSAAIVSVPPVAKPQILAPTKITLAEPISVSAPLEIAPVVPPAVLTPLEFVPVELAPVAAPLEISPVKLPVVSAPMESVPAETTQVAAATQPPTEEEQELLEIFLEEAQEVLGTISSNLGTCQSHPDNHEALVTIRRGFHTLKGSGRMVGLTDLGEVAWSVESALNKWLQDNKSATPGLLDFIGTAVQSFVVWVEMLGKQGVAHIEAADLVAAAQQIESGVDTELLTAISTPAPVQEPATEQQPAPHEGVVSGGNVLSPDLFNIASTEAKQNMVILRKEFEELRGAVPPSVHYDFMRAAHTLSGVNRTMGFAAVAELASALEGWLEARVDQVFTLSDNQFHLLDQSIAALDGMVHSIGDQQIPEMRGDLVEQLLADKERISEAHIETTGLADQNQQVETQIEAVQTQAGNADFDQMLADMDRANKAAEELSSIPETDSYQTTRQSEAHFETTAPQVSDDLYAQLMADMGKISEAEQEPVSVPEPAAHTATSQLMADVGKIAKVEELVSEPETATPEQQVVTEPVAGVASDLAAALQPVVVRTVARPADEDVEADKPQVYDDLDDQLLPVFLEEADELGPMIGEGLRAWRESPQDELQIQSLKRLLHTMKGSSRMVGAMRIGEISHEMEDRVAAAHQRDEAGYWDTLESDFDRITALLEELRGGKPVVEVKQMPTQTPSPARRAADQPAGVERRSERRGEAPLGNMLRVRSDVVDRLVNEAGEISVVRSRMETEMRVFKEGLLELTASVARLRQQLREVEIQAESQMQARVSLAKDNAEHFDPLEFDRFTRLQELTRFMNESVHDVQTVQQSMLKHLDETAAAMLAQGRLSRELQQGLMNVRMVSFNSITDRLYRIVRQTGKELSKRANLELQGTNVELDRSVLEKMIAPFEHLLRNAIVHGLENDQQRAQSGKLPIGEIRLSVRQESNEVIFEFSDDGAGLNFAKLREKAIANGTLKADEEASEDQLAQLIFMPGLSTAAEITEIAGRGVGMDVVRSEISALGGSIDVSSKSGQGTRFVIHLPLTLAVTQILMVRAGEASYAIPSTMVEQVRQVKSADMDTLHRERQVEWQGNIYPLHYLPHMLGNTEVVQENQPRNPVLLLRSGEQRIALHVDELLGNQEVMVKNIGPQLARLAGIAGATVLGNGTVVMILNPAQLAQRIVATSKPSKAASVKPLSTQPLIMVVDDSLTVRKITSRMLLRAGYQVVTATDGVDALEKLEEFTPNVMLLDIEMPRMDGFALARQLRRDPKTHDLPIIMITSRTADKHREYAMQLGVNTYLGKPYQEDDLLQNIADFVAVHKLDA
jgi:chemosensory pili system protein ChpA (sensor histidine kinase/response regulator)